MLNRRQSLRLLAGSACALFAGFGLAPRSRAAPIAVPLTLTPEQEQGPFYIESERIRRDIREHRPGVPLDLRIGLVNVTDDQPLSGAAVDIWHCDAGGVYSGFSKMKFGPPPAGAPDNDDDLLLDLDENTPPPVLPPGMGKGPERSHPPTDHATFLRGVQLTDAQGIAAFTTIYPGWYAGRDIHIHLKVHLQGAATDTAYAGGHVSHTGQLFFPDETNALVSRRQPYVRSKTPRTTKATDHVFRYENGSKSIVSLQPVKIGSESGYLATITLAIDPSATPGRVSMQ